MLRSHRHVRCFGNLAPAAERQPVDRHDDRLQEILDSASQSLPPTDDLSQGACCPAPNTGCQIGYVSAGAECSVTRTGQHNGADSRVSLAFAQRLLEEPNSVEIEGVQLLRSVDDDGGDGFATDMSTGILFPPSMPSQLLADRRTTRAQIKGQ